MDPFKEGRLPAGPGATEFVRLRVCMLTKWTHSDKEGRFRAGPEATEFVRCKIESLYANKVDPFKEGRFPAGPGATEFVRLIVCMLTKWTHSKKVGFLQGQGPQSL